MSVTEPLRIHQGIITGGVDRENPEVQVFNGIPYASTRRWTAPSDPPQWGAVTRDTRAYGPECLQPDLPTEEINNKILDGVGLPIWKRVIAKEMRGTRPDTVKAEDCLFLNIRTANRDKPRLQPVMVWVHGGDHLSGAGSLPTYQANGLVEQGVVLVTLNYRLGAFGYLAHPALTEEAGTSGNYGLLDQAAALQWVQMNISSFGGDPDNVTIFGSGAGSQSISDLMSSPVAEGLFHKAIAQSGVSSYNALHLSRSVLPGLRTSEDVGTEFLSTFADSAATANRLRAIPSGAIVARMSVRHDLTQYFKPTVDGKVVPEPIGAALRNGSAKQVPLMVGYNADEGSLYYNTLKSPTVLQPNITGSIEQREAMLEGIYGENASKALLALYGMTSLESWDEGAQEMLGDDMTGVHTRFLARMNARSGQPTWLYQFTRIPPGKSQTLGAYHTSEIPFVFGYDDDVLPVSEEDLKLSQQMVSYWANFAKTGNPNAKGLPKWPAYTQENGLWLALGHETKAVKGLRARKLDILEEHLNHRIDAISQSLPPLQLIEDTALLSTAAASSGQ